MQRVLAEQGVIELLGCRRRLVLALLEQVAIVIGIAQRVVKAVGVTVEVLCASSFKERRVNVANFWLAAAGANKKVGE